MSRRSRAFPWWERCDLLGHDCRWCRAAERRAIHLDFGPIVDLGKDITFVDVEFIQPTVRPAYEDSLVELLKRGLPF